MALMGTYEDMSVGDRFRTPSRTLDDETVHGLIGLSGFTHPLFTDPEFAKASGFGRTPLPGQAVLLLMGGLVEQTGRFDGTVIALTGFDAVRFLRPVFSGDCVMTEVEVVGKEATPSGSHGVLVMAWRCVKEGGERVAEATARMLCMKESRP
jgi:acyl dehydratase